MNAKNYDQFYTSDKCATCCVEFALKTLEKLNINPKTSLFLEPSAGDGAFIRALRTVNINNIFSCDIEPKYENIKELDFLSSDISDFLNKKQNIITIGNPPFGKKGKLASAFINTAFKYSKVVCFILPIQFNKYSGHNQIINNAKLVFNEILPENSFIFKGKPYGLRCSFQVWTIVESSLENLRIKSAPQTKHDDFEMWQYNCTKEALKYFDKKIFGWDFAVPRQGFKDYTLKITDPAKLEKQIQWIFFKAKNTEILRRLEKLDFVKLSHKNSTIPGFGKADVIEEYNKIYGLNFLFF